MGRKLWSLVGIVERYERYRCMAHAILAALVCAAAAGVKRRPHQHAVPTPWWQECEYDELFFHCEQQKDECSNTRRLAQRVAAALDGRAENRTQLIARFAGMRRTGLSWSEIGLDVSDLRQSPEDKTCAQPRHTERLVRSCTDPEDADLLDTILRVDQPPRTSCRGATSSTLGSSLRRSGFARVDNWGLDRTALRAQVDDVLAAAKRSHPPDSPLKVVATLPALLPLLQNATLAAAIRDYFDGPARYDGARVLHLSRKRVPTEMSYAPFQWHHDRCGMRLKLFVHIDDVSSSDHPTLVAAGTHRTIYFSHASSSDISNSANAANLHGVTRFAAKYVHARHKVVAMTGPAGGGFIFDTNALHAAAPRCEAGRCATGFARTSIVLEFLPHGKAPALLEANLGRLPCPQDKSFARNGFPGFPLYPQEGAT